MNISHGEFLMLGAYLTWLAHTVFGINPVAFLPVVAILLFALGIIVYRLCFQRIVRTSPSVDMIEARSLLVGFGLMYLVQNVAYLMWGADIRGYAFLSDPVEIAGIRFAGNSLLAFAFAVSVSFAMLALLRCTLYGKGVRALMQSPTGAQLVGIDTRGCTRCVRRRAWVVGRGRRLLSMIYKITPGMGEPYTVTSLIVITLGGLGSMGGAWPAACCWAWSRRSACTSPARR